MRTTVTLDPDVESMVRRLMRQRGISFKRALNEAIRAGLQPGAREQATFTRPRHLGAPSVDLDHALRVAADMEDDELIRRTRTGG